MNFNFKTPFIPLFWGFLLTLSSGTLYGVSLYADYIKRVCKFSETQIELAFTLGDVGLFTGFGIGWFQDKFGSRWLCFICGVLVFLGYILNYLMLSRVILANDVLMGFFLILIGQSSNGINSVALKTNYTNFPRHLRGRITGFLKGGFGISTAVYALFYRFAVNSDPKKLFLLSSFLLASICFIGCFCMFKVEKEKSEKIEDNNNEKIEDNNNEKIEDNNNERILLNKSVNNESNNNNTLILTVVTQNNSQVSSNFLSSSSANSIETKKKNLQDVPTIEKKPLDITGKELFLQFDFWIVMIMYGIGNGVGTIVINNLSDINNAIKTNSTYITNDELLIFLSVGNCIGRLLIGIVYDWSYVYLSSPSHFLLCDLFIGIAQILIVYIPSDSLWIATTFAAFMYGCNNSMCAIITTEFFGVDHFGFNYGFITMTPGIGGIIFGIIFGKIYEDNGVSKHECYGRKCFEDTMFLMAGMCGIASILGCILVYRRRNLMFQTN